MPNEPLVLLKVVLQKFVFRVVRVRLVLFVLFVGGKRAKPKKRVDGMLFRLVLLVRRLRVGVWGIPLNKKTVLTRKHTQLTKMRNRERIDTTPSEWENRFRN